MSIDLGLCMIVKDEENRIDGCLRDIIDLFHDVVIIDTGSTDSTRNILRNRYGIDPVVKKMQPEKFEEHDARNLASSLIKTPYIMTLDADERVERRALQAFIESKQKADCGGYFCTWDTHIGDRVIRDYKCLVFRNDVRMCGNPHENPQFDLRQRNIGASWIDRLRLHHYPERRKLSGKTRRRTKSMLQAIEKEPEWYRYYWFLGYTFFRQGQLDRALLYLATASASCSPLFPVECLNSKMIMATIYASQGEREKVDAILCDALDLYQKFQQDFEVRFNTRMRPWLERALLECKNNNLEQIKAYEFAY